MMAAAGTQGAINEAAVLEHALAAHQRGDAQATLVSSDVLLAARSDHHLALFLKGVAIFRLGRGAEGVAFVERAAALAPEAVYRTYLADMHRVLGRPDAAADALRAACALAPCDAALIDRLLSLDAGVDGSEAVALRARKRLLVPEELPAETVRAASRHYHRNSEAFAQAFPSAGPRWGEYARRMREFIATNTSAAAAVHFAQSEVDFESRRECREEDLTLAQLMRSTLERDFPEARDVIPYFSDSPLSLPETMRREGNVLVSKYLYYFARRALKANCLIGRPDVVCDIGGGTGMTGRLWLMSGRFAPRTYIIVDLPESLYFSQLYLMAHLGEDQVGMVQDDGLAPHRDKKVILVPIDRIDALYGLRIDLMTNFGSMQEMSEYWVDFYHRVFDKIDAGYFYSCNYFAQPADVLGESANLWSPRLGRRWRTFSAEINPWIIRMLTFRSHLEWIVKRHDEPLPAGHLAERFEELIRHRAVEASNLFELMDVFRLSLSPAHAAGIVEKYRSTNYKEVLFLAQWLSGDVAAGLASDVKETVDGVRQRLASLRSGGIESVVWPPT